MSHRPRIGFAVNHFQGLPPARIIDALRLIGVEFVEINSAILPEWPSLIPALKNLTAAVHLPLVHEDGWDFSCADQADRIEAMIALINEQHEALRLRHAISHPPEGENAPLDDTLVEYMFENLKRLEIPIYLENVPHMRVEVFQRIYQTGQRIMGEKLAGLCWDAPHYHVTGYDAITQFERDREKIGCIHLSDCYPDDDVHLPFDAGGSLYIDDILDMLHENKFKGFITLEIKPKSIEELDAFIHSYLKTLKYLDKPKYRRTRLALSLVRPWMPWYLRRFHAK